MKKMLFAWSSFLLLTIVYISQGFASSILSNDEIIKKFKTAYPNIPLHSIAASPVEGVFEIVSGANIAYYYPEKDILIIGRMIQKGVNITNERIMTVQSEKVKTIPLDKGLKIGNGKHIVIEFTDPDCSFCRKAFGYFKGRQDVTKYIFFLPLTNLHPQAAIKARYILDAEDKEKSYADVMGGLLDEKDLSQHKFSDHANALLSEQVNIATKLGINSTPTFWINGQYVPGADIVKFNQLLGEKSENIINKGAGD